MKFIFDCVRSRSRYRGTIAAMYYRLKSGMGHELLNLPCLSWLTDKTFFLPPTVLNYPFSHHFSKSSHWFISHFSLPYYVSLWTGSFRLEWPMKQTDSISISTLWLRYKIIEHKCRIKWNLDKTYSNGYRFALVLILLFCEFVYEKATQK